MAISPDWFDDPEELLNELRRYWGKNIQRPIIPGYTDVFEAGCVGRGVCYHAIQRSTGRRVVIKVLPNSHFTSQTERRRFEREIEVVATIRHQNIARVHDSGTNNDSLLYLVMEYVRGTPLCEWCTAAGLPAAETKGRAAGGCTFRGSRSAIRDGLCVFLKVCAAVDHVHQRGVMHGDLKPSNIIIDWSGEPHILEFGLAAYTADWRKPLAALGGGQLLASLPWIGPEQANGLPEGLDVRTDVYSLGVVLYQMLTGSFPYEVTGTVRDVLRNILQAEPHRLSRINKEIDDNLEAIVLKCLAKGPQQRHQSAGELAKEIRYYLVGVVSQN